MSSRPVGKKLHRSAGKPPTPSSAPPPPKKQHKIGYARVSMADQNPRMQIDALIAAGVAECDIYHEKVSGVAKRRPQFEMMMNDVREGDVVYVWKLDRLARSAIALYNVAEAIRAKGADLAVITMPGLDTQTAMGRAMFGMLSVFAEFERQVIWERTMAGLAAARAKGRFGGTKAKHENAAILQFASLGDKAGAKKAKMSLSGFVKARKRAEQARDQVNGQS